jgi:hypothetical protein
MRHLKSSLHQMRRFRRITMLMSNPLLSPKSAIVAPIILKTVTKPQEMGFAGEISTQYSGNYLWMQASDKFGHLSLPEDRLCNSTPSPAPVTRSGA